MTRDILMPDRTRARAALAKPILDLFDIWIAKNRGQAEARSPLAAAIGYYDNQRDALHRFLSDGRLRLDNSISEQQLRNVVLGRLYAKRAVMRSSTGRRQSNAVRATARSA